jgi:uroporphyrinogen-III decarboxylase
MRIDQWQKFKAAAKRQPMAEAPLALIVDSPWMPGYLGIGHLDYYNDPEVWFQANLKLAREFPEVILFPSWWVEYGMGIEPSAFGTRLHFFPDQTPGQTAVLFRAEDIDRFSPINPLADGLMPLALHRYRTQKQRIFDAGFTIPVVTARGPLCTAGFVRGVNDFMMDLADNPDAAHRLLRFSTEATIRWLGAQAEAIGPSVEGIFVLDDIAGFLSRRMYQEFAHPYFKQVCDAFPKEWVKVYHNDAKIKPFMADLPDTGFDVLNFTHNLDIADVRAATAGRICLMGNVNPLDIGARGTPEQVKEAAAAVLQKMNGEGMILSLGGGVSPGMPAGNVHALVAAVQEFSAAPAPVR